MIVIVSVLFSVAWAACLWAVLLAAIGAGFSRHCHPRIHLALIGAAILPSLLVLAGWLAPLPPSQPTRIVGDFVEFGLQGLVASIDGVATRSPGGGFEYATELLAGLYVTGVVVQLARLFRAHRRLVACRRGAEPLDGFSSRWPLLVAASPVSPFAIGGRNTAIVLPASLVRQWPATTVAMVIAHEEAHLRHRDPAIAMILATIGALFWFNPFLGDLISRWRQACELRADATVLRGAPRAARKQYAGALVDALRLASAAARPGFSTSFTSQALRREKMRFSAVMQGGYNFAGRGPGVLIAYAAICLLLVAGGAGGLTAASAAGSEIVMDSFIPGGRLTAPFGIKRKNLRVHTGVDVAAPMRTPIIAPADATVVEATDLFRNEPRYGKAVVLRFDNDLVGWFTHVDSYFVKPGDRVDRGEIFATVGRTGQASGSHVHIETYRGRRRVDPATVWSFLKN